MFVVHMKILKNTIFPFTFEMKIFDYVLSCVYKYTCVETVLSAMELRKFIFVEKGLNKIKKVEKRRQMYVWGWRD